MNKFKIFILIKNLSFNNKIYFKVYYFFDLKYFFNVGQKKKIENNINLLIYY